MATRASQEINAGVDGSEPVTSQPPPPPGEDGSEPVTSQPPSPLEDDSREYITPQPPPRTNGSQSAPPSPSKSETTSTAVEEEAFPQMYSTVIPIDNRAPMPIPASEVGNQGSVRRPRFHQSPRHRGLYQSIPRSEGPDTSPNNAYGVVGGDPCAYQTPLESPSPEKLFTVDIKRYILSTMGMLHFPKTRISCGWIAVPFYFIIILWGGAIIVLSSFALGTVKESKRESTLLFSITMLAGLFFVLLGVYWMLVFWWFKMSRENSKRIRISSLFVLWFFLAMLFMGTTASLATGIYEHHDLILNETYCSTTTMVMAKEGNCSGGVMEGSECSMRKEKEVKISDNDSFCHIRFFPLAVLCSMGVLWAVYVLVLLYNMMLVKRVAAETRLNS